MAGKWESLEQAQEGEPVVDIDKLKEQKQESEEAPAVEETPEEHVETEASTTEEAPEVVAEETAEEPDRPEVTPEETPEAEPETAPEPEEVKVKIGDEEVPVNQVKELLDMQHEKITDLQKKAELADRIEANEDLMNMIKHYENGGDLTDFLQSKQDFSKVGDLDLIREDFEKEYEGIELDSGLKDRAFKKHLVDKYKLDPDGELGFDEDEVAMGEARLKRDAKVLREKKIEAAKSFKIAERKEVEPTQDRGQEVDLDQVRENVKQNPVTQELLKTKMLKLGDANFELKTDPEQMAEMAVDGNKFWQLFIDEKSGTDYNHFYDVVAHAAEPEAYKEFWINQGRMQERDAQLREAKKLDDGHETTVEKQGLSDKEKLKQAILKGKWSNEIRA